MKVVVLTGKRGGFGAMKSMLRLMRDDPFFELDLVACDMHVDERFGRTVREAEAEFKVIKLTENLEGEPRELYLGAIARNIAGLWQREKYRPDLLMLYGDRGESLAAAMVATELCIPIAHLQGGDTSGTMDDRRRHAISQLSVLHFVSCKESGHRLAAILPSVSTNIHVVGDSHLDPIFEVDYDKPMKVCLDLGLSRIKPIIIILHHPDPTDPVTGADYINNIMEAINSPEHQIIMIYPCSDPGWESVVEAIHNYEGHNVQIHKNLPSQTFLGLMNIADCIVGNSSAGLIEAPYLDLPCVNVGHRQDERLRSNNIIDTDHIIEHIETAFNYANSDQFLRDRGFPFKKLYGNGATGKRIIEHLKKWRVK